MIAKDVLTKVARQAMLDNGLNPDFGDAVLRQAGGILHAAAETGGLKNARPQLDRRSCRLGKP